MNVVCPIANYSKHRFLIVDDKEFLKNMLQRILSRCSAGFIYQAKDGAAAIKTLGDSCGDIDCIISDWYMEPINGIELLRAIRCGDVRHTRRDSRFIMLTGYGEERVVSAALQLDINGYVTKPVSMSNLVRAINNVFTTPPVLRPSGIYKLVEAVSLPTSEEPASDGRSNPTTLLSYMQLQHGANSSTNPEAISGKKSDSNIGIRLINKSRLTLDKIHVGRILAKDIYGNGGILLLAVGTVLNEVMIRRISRLPMENHEPIQLLVGDYN